jgi:hypothetical protein
MAALLEERTMKLRNRIAFVPFALASTLLWTGAAHATGGGSVSASMSAYGPNPLALYFNDGADAVSLYYLGDTYTFVVDTGSLLIDGSLFQTRDSSCPLAGQWGGEFIPSADASKQIDLNVTYQIGPTPVAAYCGANLDYGYYARGIPNANPPSEQAISYPDLSPEALAPWVIDALGGHRGLSYGYSLLYNQCMNEPIGQNVWSEHSYWQDVLVHLPGTVHLYANGGGFIWGGADEASVSFNLPVLVYCYPH